MKDGFRVTLVAYTYVHIEAYYEKTIILGRDGMVKLEKPAKLLQKLGEGIFF